MSISGNYILCQYLANISLFQRLTTINLRQYLATISLCQHLSTISLCQHLANINLRQYVAIIVGRDSSVGIATRYGLEGPGDQIPTWHDFPHPSRPALGPTQPLKQWAPALSRGVKRPGRGIDQPLAPI